MDELLQKRYTALLHAKETELLAGLHNRDGLAAESEPDLFDEIQRAMDRALIVQTLDHSSTLLRDVRAALARIGDGVYGTCLRCEGEINPKRLAALPWARFCLACQQQADREEDNRPDGVLEIPVKVGASWD